MGSYTEIIGKGSVIYSRPQKIIYRFGKYKIVRKLYWRYFRTYLWGIENFRADIMKRYVNLIDKGEGTI